MARDFAEMEREFLGGLKSETGKDLMQWMAAISAAGPADRNATIDWLKAQGFAFSRASWLERIHSNGGRPVYIDRVDARPEAANPGAVTASAPAPILPPVSVRKPAPQIVSDAAAAAVPATPRPGPPAREAARPVKTADLSSLETVLSAAKGYRPLCTLLLDQIRALVASVDIVPVDGHLSIRAPGEFAALTVSANQLRLGLALGERRFDALAQKARLKDPGPQMTHMVVLNDARQVGPELAELILEAKKRINA